MKIKKIHKQICILTKTTVLIKLMRINIRKKIKLFKRYRIFYKIIIILSLKNSTDLYKVTKLLYKKAQILLQIKI